MHWCQVGLHTICSLDLYIVQDYYWNISPDNFLPHAQPCMTHLYPRYFYICFYRKYDLIHHFHHGSAHKF